MTASGVHVGLIESYRYPVGRTCVEAVRGFGESGDHEDARRELAEELGVDGQLLDLGVIDPDTGMVELPVRLYGCLVTGERVIEPDPTESTLPVWLPVQEVWESVRTGRITCAMTLSVLLRAQLAGLLPGPGAPTTDTAHRTMVAAAALGVDAEQVRVLENHPSVEVRAAAVTNPRAR